jgi:hypothetical protein
MLFPTSIICGSFCYYGLVFGCHVEQMNKILFPSLSQKNDITFSKDKYDNFLIMDPNSTHIFWRDAVAICHMAVKISEKIKSCHPTIHIDGHRDITCGDGNLAFSCYKNDCHTMLAWLDFLSILRNMRLLSPNANHVTQNYCLPR